MGLPGGNIFHRDLKWPCAEEASEVGTWGVETATTTCGSAARAPGAAAASAASRAQRDENVFRPQT